MTGPPVEPSSPHVHEPNPTPPGPDPAFRFISAAGGQEVVHLVDLCRLPAYTVSDCWIVSTGHGASGPFAFTGARLQDLVTHLCPHPWQEVVIEGGDGFGTRLSAAALAALEPERPALLAYAMEGAPIDRAAGLVRLIVPGDRDDALRQVKWIGEIRVL